jgi:AcrR family transcriptional regulator
MTSRNPSRRRGRPAVDATTDQRQHLLDAAVALFAEHGIAATPLSAIARSAGVTPALLHYYFGNREQLVDAVVEERLLPLMLRATAPIADAGSDLITALSGFARQIMQTLADNPWLPPLWLREVIGAGGLLRERLLGRVAPPIATRLAALAADAQARGELHPALDPRLLLVSLVGLTVFPFAVAPIWRQLPGNADIDPETLIRHMLAMLQHGLEPPHAPSA